MNKGWDDVLPGCHAGESPRSWVLHILQSVSGFAQQAGQNAIVVDQVRSDKDMNKGLGYTAGERKL